MATSKRINVLILILILHFVVAGLLHVFFMIKIENLRKFHFKKWKQNETFTSKHCVQIAIQTVAPRYDVIGKTFALFAVLFTMIHVAVILFRFSLYLRIMHDLMLQLSYSWIRGKIMTELQKLELWHNYGAGKMALGKDGYKYTIAKAVTKLTAINIYLLLQYKNCSVYIPKTGQNIEVHGHADNMKWFFIAGNG